MNGTEKLQAIISFLNTLYIWIENLKRRKSMAVTEVKQQQAIMQKLAEMKKGGASDTEIDRKE